MPSVLRKLRRTRDASRVQASYDKATVPRAILSRPGLTEGLRILQKISTLRAPDFDRYSRVSAACAVPARGKLLRLAADDADCRRRNKAQARTPREYRSNREPEALLDFCRMRKTFMSPGPRKDCSRNGLLCH